MKKIITLLLALSSCAGSNIPQTAQPAQTPNEAEMAIVMAVLVGFIIIVAKK